MKSIYHFLPKRYKKECFSLWDERGSASNFSYDSPAVAPRVKTCLLSLTHQRTNLGSVPSCSASSLAEKLHLIHQTELEGGKPAEPLTDCTTELQVGRVGGWLCEGGGIWGRAWTSHPLHFPSVTAYWQVKRWWRHVYWGGNTHLSTLWMYELHTVF